MGLARIKSDDITAINLNRMIRKSWTVYIFVH